MNVNYRLCLLVLVLFGLDGCTPVPFISPPIRASVGFGPAGGERTNADSGEIQKISSVPVIAARFGFNPLGLMHDQMDRLYDVGIGYGIENTLSEDPPRALLHGPYVEASAYFYRHMLTPNSVLRLGVISRGELLFSDAHSGKVGSGVTGGLVFEYSWFGLQGIGEEKTTVKHRGRLTTTETRPSMIGVSYGEMGIGLEILGGYREVGPEKYWVVLGALAFRLPASAGVYFVYWDEQKE